MFWFKKKAKNDGNNEAELKTEIDIEADKPQELDEDLEIEEFVTDEEIEKELASEDDEEYDEYLEYEEAEGTAEFNEDGEADEGSEEPEDIPELTVKISSLDDMAEFMNLRRSSGMQFMKKDTFEAFEIRERHLRIARVWGSVSMSRECSPEEYGKIMLALELIHAPEAYYVFPLLEEKVLKAKIQEFCEQKYGIDGKKYSKAPEKFASLLNENGDIPEWRAFSKEAMYDLAAEFCENNSIDFSELEDESDE